MEEFLSKRWFDLNFEAFLVQNIFNKIVVSAGKIGLKLKTWSTVTGRLPYDELILAAKGFLPLSAIATHVLFSPVTCSATF